MDDPMVTAGTMLNFQARVSAWMHDCFATRDAMMPAQRSFRFTEEALELAQAMGTSRADVLRLVEYVYGRPVGDVVQEIGGVAVTLAGVATSHGFDLGECAEAELIRCTVHTDRIRAKDLAKPKRSPLSIAHQPVAQWSHRRLLLLILSPWLALLAWIGWRMFHG